MKNTMGNETTAIASFSVIFESNNISGAYCYLTKIAADTGMIANPYNATFPADMAADLMRSFITTSKNQRK